MKVSVPLRDGEAAFELPGTTDPHVDPMKMPRFSAPLSFLSRRAFLMAVTLLAVFFPVTTVQAAGTCVCNYDANKDYFPVKLSPQYATMYNISYHNSYKKIVSFGASSPVVTYAYLCGTPRPAEATDANSIQIPIDSSALTSTTFLPLIAYLGARTSIKFMPEDPSDLPACSRKLYLAGQMVADFNMDGNAATVTNLAFGATNETLDVVFSDTYSWNPYKGTPLQTRLPALFGTHTRAFLVAQDKERHVLGPVEWLEPIAALYNREQEASLVVSNIMARYSCLKNLILANPPLQRKKVLWGNFYQGTYYFGTCPNYYCQLIADAGADIVFTSDFSQNETEALRMVSEADVWIYPDGNFLQNTSFNIKFLDGDRETKFGNLNVIKNKMVFDYLGSFETDWWDYRMGEPDVLFMDVIQAIWGDTYISNTRPKRFLRNVFTEPMADQTPRDPAQCPDEAAPLYTDWLTGPCFSTSAGILGDTNNATTLCLDSSDASCIGPHMMTALVAVLMGMLGLLF